MRSIRRSFGLILLLVGGCADVFAQNPAITQTPQTQIAPAQAAPAAPGISVQLPGIPFAPVISVPVPGLPQIPVAVQPQAPAAVPLQQQLPGGVMVQPQQPSKPSVAELSFVIDSNVNPDATGRPSPVVVRIYELRSVAAFNKADFFSLYERDKEQLGPELVSRDELPLMPGGKPQAITTLRSDTRYVGVVAAFRDIERARWRASTPIFVNQTTRMEIKLDRNEIAIRLQ